MAMLHRLLLSYSLVLALAPGTAAAQGRLPVLATFSILGDVVQNVGGDLIDLQVLVGHDQDTHELEPGPVDALALRRAGVIFENGLGFEGWLDRLYIASGSQARRVVATAGIEPFFIVENGVREEDPHVWGDARNVISMATVVAAALAEADPAHADAYMANAAIYGGRLAKIDGWIEQRVGTLPAERRRLFSNHDALGYFARRYGLELAGSVIQGFSTESQPSAQRVAQVVRDLRASGARVLFIENAANPVLAEQVARSAGARIAPPLFTDALGAWETPGGTYIGLMIYNASTIVMALSS